MRTPKWARIEESDYAENKLSALVDDETVEETEALSALFDMTRSTGRYVDVRKARTLSAQNFTAQRLRDVTLGYSRRSSVNCIKFHPSRPILVTAARQGALSLFDICEDLVNPSLKPSGDFFLQDIKFKDRITSFDFFDDGNAVFVVPDSKKYCYTYDLMEGKVSQINFPSSLSQFAKPIITKAVLSADGVYVAYLFGSHDVYVFVLETMQHLHTFHAESPVADIRFSNPNRNIVYAFSVDGVAYMWDLHRKAEQTRFVDDGCVMGTTLAVSPNEQFIACGSNTGIVNVYESVMAWRAAAETNRPPNSSASEAEEEGHIMASAVASQVPAVKPLYTLSNLTTEASFIAFNHDSQLMAFGSYVKPMTIRLLHCCSGNVYSKFPARNEMLAKDQLTSIAFSPHSAFVAFGGTSGQCLLYRLEHFSMY